MHGLGYLSVTDESLKVVWIFTWEECSSIQASASAVSEHQKWPGLLQVLTAHAFPHIWLVVPGKEGSLMGPHMYFFKQSTPAPNRRKPPLKASVWANLWRDEWPNRDLPSSQAAASGLRDEGPGLVWPLHRPGWAWHGNLQPGFHFHKKMLLPHWVFQTRLSYLAKFYRANLVEVEVGSWMRMGGWGGAGGGRCNFGSFHFLQCCPFPPSPAAQTHTHRNRHSLPILKLFSANINLPDIRHVSLSVNLHFSQFKIHTHGSQNIATQYLI